MSKTDKELDELEARAGNAHGNDCRDGSHMDLIGDLADAIAELRKKNAGLEKALRNIEVLWQRDDEDSIDRFERVAELFYRDTRIMAPGKSVALAMADSQPSDEARREAYDKWVGEKIAQARQALKENTQ